MKRGHAGLIAIGWLAVAAGPARAQPSDALPPAHHVEPPPAPESRDPELNAELRVGAVMPLESSDICPGRALCVLGAGGTFGVEIERRWPMGLGISVAYDGWFVDSGGVFELGVVQIVRAAIRYVFTTDLAVHPWVQIGAGALWFGDTLLVSTVGGAANGGAGVEIELTDIVALTGSAQTWFFTTSPFTTDRDRIRRSAGQGLNVALQLSVGLSILAGSGGL